MLVIAMALYGENKEAYSNFKIDPKKSDRANLDDYYAYLVVEDFLIGVMVGYAIILIIGTSMDFYFSCVFKIYWKNRLEKD